MSNIYPGVWERFSLLCYLSAAPCCGVAERKALGVSCDSASRRLESWAHQIRGLVLSSLLCKTQGSVEMNSTVLSNSKACGSLFPLSTSGPWKRLSLDSDPEGCSTCWRVAGRLGFLLFLPLITHIFPPANWFCELGLRILAWAGGVSTLGSRADSSTGQLPSDKEARGVGGSPSCHPLPLIPWLWWGPEC